MFGCGVWVSPDRTNPTHEPASNLPSAPPWAHSCAADDGASNLLIALHASHLLACSSHVGWKLVGWIPWQGPNPPSCRRGSIFSIARITHWIPPVGSRRPLPFSAPVSPWVVMFTTEGREGRPGSFFSGGREGNEPSHDDRRFSTREAPGNGR